MGVPLLLLCTTSAADADADHPIMMVNDLIYNQGMTQLMMGFRTLTESSFFQQKPARQPKKYLIHTTYALPAVYLTGTVSYGHVRYRYIPKYYHASVQFYRTKYQDSVYLHRTIVRYLRK